MAYPTRIVLTGFMGSGKSTVGRLLASRLGYAYVDLDAAIEERVGKSVPEIFAKEGELAFRIHEHDALRKALSRSSVVIALGGGAVETVTNRVLLAVTADTTVVWLTAPFEALYQRCCDQAQDSTATERPNLSTRENALERFYRRQPLYASTATLTADSSTLTAEETAVLILETLSL